MEVLFGLPQRVINLDDKDFEQVALEVFRFQAGSNQVYRDYLGYLGINVEDVKKEDQIPFLPIELFKTRKIISGTWKPKVVFTSSGTGSGLTSKHYIQDPDFYSRVTTRIFEGFYGPPDRYHILALLPSYLERSGSSLVFMIEHFIKKSGSKYSGFYLHDYQKLKGQLQALKADSDRKIMLWGVSFALLDLAERGSLDLSGAVIIETGGMKGRREEIIREELHARLKASFGEVEIQSEYGMAELLSQAYTVTGRFRTAPWMKVKIRDISDPFDQLSSGRVGGINVMDLANIHSCAFIETQDLGEVDESGSFRVLGRMDNSDVRGCNLFVE